MRKFLSLALAALLILSLTACGSQQKTYDLDSIAASFMETLADSEPLKMENAAISDLYNTDPADVKNAVCIVTMGGTGAFPDEIIMMEAVDDAAAGRIQSKLEARLADVTNQAQNYDADSLALFQSCKVERFGNYVNLFISPDAQTLREIFAAAGK